VSRRGRVSPAGGAADGAGRSTRTRPPRFGSSGFRSAWFRSSGFRSAWFRSSGSRSAWLCSAWFRRSAAVTALALVAALAGCTTEATTGPGPQQTPSPFQDCATLSGGSGAPADLPDLKLPCFTGGAAVPLAGVRGPAVINIWATWCGPCRAELPAMQRLADRTKGRLRVIGVDTGDSRDAAASFGTDKHVTLPTLYDAERKLVGALGRTALPVTVFLDPSGKRFVYNQLPPDEARLAALVRTHTGLTVTG
jgi:cytochrome c biogenesis protein CcmG/thiol:disulfide interchange protein DsbE